MSEIWRERKARREERRARAEAVAVFSLAENTWRGEIERLRMERKKALRFDALMADYEAEREENERLREALRYYAKNHYPDVDAGPWGANSADFGDVARAALREEKSYEDRWDNA